MRASDGALSLFPRSVTRGSVRPPCMGEESKMSFLPCLNFFRKFKHGRQTRHRIINSGSLFPSPHQLFYTNFFDERKSHRERTREVIFGRIPARS